MELQKMQSVQNHHFDELDIVKGLAIITVILEHSFSVKYIDLSDIAWCNTTIAVIKSFNMQLFFVVSGFLFFHSKSLDVRKMFMSKIDRLLVPYIFLSVVSVTAKYCFPSLLNKEVGGGIIDVLVGIVFKGGETFWFVHTLFLIFCVLIPLKKYLNDVSVSLGLFLLILIREVSLFETIPTINGLLFYGSFFLMGYYVRKFYYDGYRKLLENGKNMVITFIMWLLLFALFPENNVVFNWYMPILMGSVFWGVSLRIKSSNVIYKLLKYYGLNSLQFYLFNGYALVISRMLVKNIHIGNIPVLVFSVFVCCMALLTIMVEITKKNKLISYLCGYGKK